jgi:hypothetical protein
MTSPHRFHKRCRSIRRSIGRAKAPPRDLDCRVC